MIDEIYTTPNKKNALILLNAWLDLKEVEKAEPEKVKKIGRTNCFRYLISKETK